MARRYPQGLERFGVPLGGLGGLGATYSAQLFTQSKIVEKRADGGFHIVYRTNPSTATETRTYLAINTTNVGSGVAFPGAGLGSRSNPVSVSLIVSGGRVMWRNDVTGVTAPYSTADRAVPMSVQLGTTAALPTPATFTPEPVAPSTSTATPSWATPQDYFTPVSVSPGTATGVPYYLQPGSMVPTTPAAPPTTPQQVIVGPSKITPPMMLAALAGLLGFALLIRGVKNSPPPRVPGGPPR